MNNKNIQSSISNEIKNLRYSFSELDSKFNLTINNININFLKTSEYNGHFQYRFNNGNFTNEWLRLKHKKGRFTSLG